MLKIFVNNILQRYLVREWFQTFLPSLACFEAIIFLGFAIQVLHKGLDIIALRSLIPHIFIQAAPYSIPSALLTATTMTYGRMSADHEIMAIQASGVHLRKIIFPVLLIGVIFSFLALALSAEIVPRSLYKIKSLQEQAINNILAGRLATFQKKIDLHPYQIYIGSMQNNVNKDISVIQYADDYVTDVILAEEGFIKMNEQKSKILLTLRNGEFIKPNYQKIEEIPRIGVFKETTFEISLDKRDPHSSTKFLTIFQLLKKNQELDRELQSNLVTPENQEFTREKLAKELDENQKKLHKLNKKLKDLETKLKQSKQKLSRQKSKIEGMENESKIAKNYLLVASENLNQVKRDYNSGSYLFEEEMDRKILQIKATIEREKERIQAIEEKIKSARNTQIEKTKDIAQLTAVISKYNKKRDALLSKIRNYQGDLSIANMKRMREKNDISIHKRLSQALSCMSFIILGIPLGIKLRSSHMIVGFGASFMVILFVYYPLVVTGSVMAEDTSAPIIPSLWAANIVLFICGIVLFRKLFGKRKPKYKTQGT